MKNVFLLNMLQLLLFFVILLHMISMCKTYSQKMKNAAISPDFLRFLVCLFICALLVLVVTMRLQPAVQNVGDEIIPLEPAVEEDSSVNPDDFQKLAVNHARKSDTGLLLYRDEATKDKVVWFYSHITGSETVANAILVNADKNDIPLSLAFALSYVESRYKARAVNHNKNSTVDRGLFQLNSSSFSKLSEEEYFNPDINAKYGLTHLRFCLDTAGNEVAALAMYNAGTVKVKSGSTPQMTLNYVSKIMSYREGLESLFAQEIVAKLETNQPVRLAALN